MLATLLSWYRTRKAMAALPGAEVLPWDARLARLALRERLAAVTEAVGSRAPVGHPERLDSLEDFVLPIEPEEVLPKDEDPLHVPFEDDGPMAQHHAIQELHDLVYWLLRYAFYLGAFGVFMFYPPVDQWGALTLGCVTYMSMTHAHRGVYQVAVDYTPREPARAALVATMAVGFWGVMNGGWVVWALYQSLDNVEAWTTQIGVWHRLGTDPAVFLAFFNDYWSSSYAAFTDACYEARWRNLMGPLSPWHQQVYLFFEQLFRLLVNPVRSWEEVAYTVYASQTPYDLAWAAFAVVDANVTLVAFALTAWVLNAPFALADTVLWLAQISGIASGFVLYALPPLNAWAVDTFGVDLVAQGWVSPWALTEGWIHGPVHATSYEALPPVGAWGAGAAEWWAHGLVVPRSEAPVKAFIGPVGWFTPWIDYPAEWTDAHAKLDVARRAYLHDLGHPDPGLVALHQGFQEEAAWRYRWGTPLGLVDEETYQLFARYCGDPVVERLRLLRLTDPDQLGKY